MQTLTLHIPSMRCSHCTNKIQTFVSEVDGVSSIDFCLDSKEIHVVFDLPATKEKIIEAILECGFEVR